MTSAIASFVISVTRLSIGVIRTLTAKTALDPGVGGGEPGERMAPEAEERRRPEGDQDQVAGVARDAREHADQDDDERDRARGRDARRACGSARPSGPAFSATPTPIMATKITATTLKLAKLVTNEEKMKRSPSTESRLSISVVSVWISGSCVLVRRRRDLRPRAASSRRARPPRPRSAAARRPRR